MMIVPVALLYLVTNLSQETEGPLFLPAWGPSVLQGLDCSQFQQAGTEFQRYGLALREKNIVYNCNMTIEMSSEWVVVCSL